MNDVEYSLPFKASELFDLGWVPNFADVNADTLDSATYSSYTLKKGAQNINVLIANPTNSTAVLNDCMVMEITVYDNSNVTFETKSGIKIGDSYKTVYELYGEDKYNSGIGGTQLSYSFLESLLSDGRLSSIGSTNNFSDDFTVQWNEYDNISTIRMKLVLFISSNNFLL